MKKVLKFVKGKKDERKENGSITPSQSGELASYPQTPEDDKIFESNYSPGYTVDFSGKDKTVTKLHKAAWQGNLDKVKSALKKIEIDTVDRHNRTALHFAVVQGHPSVVWFLLGNNAKTSVCDGNGYTPLLKSIEFNHKECMALLLERGADVNATDFNGNTGLHIATKLAALDTVSSLLNKNANPEISNNAGDYPLHIAAKLENNELLEIFLCHGTAVDVMDRENRTPLMIAAKNGSFMVVDLLCKYGAQLNIVDSNGWTAEDYALLGGHENIAQLIKSLLKNIKGKYGEHGKIEVEGFSFDKSKEDNVSRHNTLMDGMGVECSGSKILGKFFRKRAGKNAGNVEKEKYEEMPDSPNTEVMPPFCQPPKSWEMIQAGMIDHNNDGNESKRRSITTLGTLHSRRGSFAEGIVSPKHTLSLNRKKHVKINNSFAKQRFSFNEEESLKQWKNEEKKIRKDLENIELEDILNLEAVDISNGSPRQKKVSNVERSRSNDGSLSLGKKEDAFTSAESSNIRTKHSNFGTLGRSDTMNEVEEIWISNAVTQFSPGSSKSKEENMHNSWESGQLNRDKNEAFPSPHSALELGIDVAKSKKYMKGISEDPTQSDLMERNLWKNINESHSFDFFEDNPKVKTFKGHFRHDSSFNENWSTEEMPKCQKPCNKMTDVNRRIKEELECYDDALRELAESSASVNFLAPTFYTVNGSLSVTNGGINTQTLFLNKKSNIKSLDHSDSFSGSSSIADKSAGPDSSRKNEPAMNNGEDNRNEPEEKQGNKTKKQSVLAMREVKHEVEVKDPSSLLGKSGEKIQLGSICHRKNSPVKKNSSATENLETTKERSGSMPKKSTSDNGTNSTLVLQEEFQKKLTNSNCQSPNSDSDISETTEGKDARTQRTFSFSPLGAIYKEIVKEQENSDKQQTGATGQDSNVAPPVENLCNPPLCDDELADFGSILEERLANMSIEENEEFHRDVRELSPDASLSSGPVEPLGLDKDSGSDPESSVNDVTPTHKYFLKVQHEWLKCHLKVATEEKSKLEGLAAQLCEKAERLQFELADAKAAAKSREEVIHLLQGHLTRMEIAYSKSLQESVQCRLELTAHEQEIHHLKQLCNKYEEQKNKIVQEAMGKDFEQLQLRIITLEEENGKMKKEILNLEQEKVSLEKIVKKTTESEDSNQLCKERCNNPKDLTAIYKFPGEPLLKGKIAENLTENQEPRIYLENIKKELEEKYINKLREKEGEMQSLVEKFNCERKSLIIGYEKKFSEHQSKWMDHEIQIFKKENERLEQMINSIQDQVEKIQKSSPENVKETLKNELKNQCGVMSKSFDEMRNKDQLKLKSLMKESIELKKKFNELNAKMTREGRNAPDVKVELFETVCENSKIKNEILGLKKQLNFLTVLVERNHYLQMDSTREKKGHKSVVNQRTKVFREEDEQTSKNIVKLKDIGIVARERSFADSMLLLERSALEIDKVLVGDNKKWPENENFGELKFNKVENSDRVNVTTKQNRENSVKCGQKLQLLEIKKEILSLKHQVSHEKASMNYIESQIAEIKLNFTLKGNPNLQQEIHKSKKKKNENIELRTEMELLHHRKDLECKKKIYLTSFEGSEQGEIHRKMCESFAKEREKSKEISKKTNRPPRSSYIRNEQRLSSILQNHLFFPPCTLPQIFWQPEAAAIPLVLHPEIKHQLEKDLNKSVMKHSSKHKENCSDNRQIKKDLLTKCFHSKMTESFLTNQ